MNNYERLNRTTSTEPFPSFPGKFDEFEDYIKIVGLMIVHSPKYLYELSAQLDDQTVILQRSGDEEKEKILKVSTMSLYLGKTLNTNGFDFNEALGKTNFTISCQFSVV